MTVTIDDLRRRADAVHRSYDQHFAGQARVSRDPSLLDAMKAELAEISEAAEPLSDAEKADLAATLAEREELYEREAASIREAQNDPRAQEVFELLTWVSVTHGRYKRFFAGKGRSSRDLGLLRELAAESERLKGLLSAVGGDDVAEAIDGLGTNANLYRAEVAAIETARATGEPGDRAGALAQAANEQIQLYRDRFVDKGRLSRRPAVLERMVGNMEGIQQGMAALKEEGLVSEELDANLEIVRGRVRFFRDELSAIRDSKSQAGIADLITALAEAANQVFQEYQETYAGQDRRTRERGQLGRMIEDLVDIGRSMEDLQRLAQLPANGANLRLVLESLRLYEREADRIAEAQDN